jgi:MFS family permease
MPMGLNEEPGEAVPASQMKVRQLPRNVKAVSLTSFLMDVSSEMVINILPLFLSNVLGVRTALIGVIEGTAEAVASLLKVFSGWLSDRLGSRKWLAVLGYGFSALSKPFFYFAHSWEIVAGARWADRVGKGIRTAPRDALVADSIDDKNRGLAFGFHRAADTAGAMLGLLIALGIVWMAQGNGIDLGERTFQIIVLVSVPPAILAVVALAWLAHDVPRTGEPGERPRFALRPLGRPFILFLLIVGVFDLGNSSDAFLVLRAQERGLSVVGVLAMLATFNLIYALISTPAGSWSDRIGRRKIIIGGWVAYALIYFGFGLAQTAWQIWMLYAIYGLYYGLAYGTAKALVADLVPAHLRGTAYGTYNATLGILDFPASAIAGVLWQGVGSWQGFGPSAPFIFGGTLALLAAAMLGISDIGRAN